MSEYTPGPWIVVGHKVYALEDCEHHPVADCTTNHTCREEWEVGANVRLISAATDLLDSLREIVEYWNSIVPTDCVNDMHIKARAAIVKATGETQ